MLKKTTRKFRPCYVNECEDIKFAIKQIASQSNKDADSFDFELQSIVTYKKNLYDHESQQVFAKDVDSFLSDRNNMLEPNLVIQQYYCILVQEKKSREIQFHLTTDKSFSEAFLNFHVGFYYSKDNLEEIYAQIRKEKAWNKILCFDEENECKALGEFLATLDYPLKEEVRYLLIRGVNLIMSEEAQLEFKKDVTAQFQTVLENEVICVYKKPSQGKPGRNIRGEYVIPPPPQTEHESCHLKYDTQSIKAEEYPFCTYFKSIAGGILNYADDVLSVEDTLETQEVSFKTTGSLIGEIDSGTVVNIKETDSLKEALGQGMKIQAGTVNVDGNVGPDAIVHSKEANIGGFTHKSSKIYADNVKVATHKGYIKGKNIQIDLLETGVIEGEKVEVDKMYGGKIYADEIIIQTLHANAFLYATKSIRVVHMKKGENKFYLAANYGSLNGDKWARLLQQKNESIENAIRLTKELKVESLELLKLKTTNDEVRSVLMQYKNTKTIPPAYLLSQFEAYRARTLALKEKRERIHKMSEDFKKARALLAQMDERTKDATVVIDSGWVEYNEVHYVFYSPSRELLCIPKPGEPSKVVYENDAIHLIL